MVYKQQLKLKHQNRSWLDPKSHRHEFNQNTWDPREPWVLWAPLWRQHATHPGHVTQQQQPHHGDETSCEQMNRIVENMLTLTFWDKIWIYSGFWSTWEQQKQISGSILFFSGHIKNVKHMKNTARTPLVLLQTWSDFISKPLQPQKHDKKLYQTPEICLKKFVYLRL